jgi:hypothetical protein
MHEGDKPLRVSRKSWWMNRWFLPVFSLAMGLGMWGAFWAGGDPTGGAVSFAVMAIFGAVFFFGGKSETIRGMRGDGRDERWAMIDQQATAFAGLTVITATLVGFGIEVAHGRDGSPYGQLAAIAGIAYLLAFFVARWRS